MVSAYFQSVLIYLYYVQSCFTAPTPDDTNSSSSSDSPKFVGYVGDPNGRGTASLVISCLLTLILCVWSALHLNIPFENQTTLGHFLLNLRWIVAGVYAPELVVFTAWRQWSSARILGSLVKDSQERQQAPNLSAKHYTSSRYEWTMTHSFFACTGGFVFEIQDEGRQASQPFLPATCPRRLTLTARGMALLARCGYLPDISKAEITDKSKANDIAKGLVLIQASWMLVQVIGRLSAKLPVTLLEVNTIAHVYVYIRPCNKPLLTCDV